MCIKMKLTISGSFFGTDGYSSHTRQLANALGKYHDVKILTNLIPDWESKCNDFELEAIKKPDSKEVMICIGMPQSWPMFLSDRYKYFICFLVWEGDKIPDFWVDYIADKRVNQVWVPSEHTKLAVLKGTGGLYEDKLRIVPHGADINVFKPNPVKHDKFTFVCNKGWRGTSWDRGGVQHVIKAFSEEFKPEEPVELKLKLNPAYINLDIAKESIKRIVGKPCNIIINVEDIKRKGINELYNSSDCYVSAQLADAFDLCSTEAMSTGLPVIVGGYGGQIEHVPDDCGFKLGFKLEKVQEDIMYEEVNWGTPNLDDLKSKMRWCFEHKQEISEMGQKAREFIVNNFTWDMTALKATKFLEELK